MHLDFEGVDAAAITRARAAGVKGFVVPGVEPAQWERAAALKLPMCVGVHPQRSATITAKDLIDAARRFGAVGIGECGLDKRGPTTHEAQLTSLREHLAAARELDLPLVLHVVQRHAAALDAVKGSRGMVHAFVGSTEVAEQWLDRGWYLSVGPMVLRSRKLRDAVGHIPLDRLLLETDAPDGAPEPAGLVDVLDAVTELREESREAIADASDANARALFGLSARRSV